MRLEIAENARGNRLLGLAGFAVLLLMSFSTPIHSTSSGAGETAGGALPANELLEGADRLADLKKYTEAAEAYRLFIQSYPGTSDAEYAQAMLVLLEKRLDEEARVDAKRLAEKEAIKAQELQARRAQRLQAMGQTQSQGAASPAVDDSVVQLDTKSGISFRKIESGTFAMGCAPGDTECGPGEMPWRTVVLSAPFLIAETETTKEQFARFVAETGYVTSAERYGVGIVWSVDAAFDRKGATWEKPGFSQGPDHPVVQVSWYDADAFCKWAGGTLPSESQWEMAARAGLAEKYATGNATSHELANYGGKNGTFKKGADKWHTTSPVKSFPPNAFGLYDMQGNALEWTEDWWREDPVIDRGLVKISWQAQFSNDIKREAARLRLPSEYANAAKVARGGSFLSREDEVRVSSRIFLPPIARLAWLGFRCARPLGETP